MFPFFELVTTVILSSKTKHSPFHKDFFSETLFSIFLVLILFSCLVASFCSVEFVVEFVMEDDG